METNFTYCPLVTIIIPVYNGEAFLGKAIDSALAQTYPNKEILVISDGSTDGSDEIAKSYGDRIRFLRKENGGVSTVLNRAIAEMKGEWLSWLSHDDTYAPEKLSAQVGVLGEIVNKNGTDGIDRIVVCCANDRIDANDRPVKRKVKYGTNFDSPKQTLISQIGNYTIGGCCVLASKAAYLAEGGFNENNRTCSDAEMWYRLMLDGYKFVFHRQVLVHSRQHGGMVSVQKQELCKTEGTRLHEEIFDLAMKKGLTEQEQYRFLCALSARGYGAAAQKKLRECKISASHRFLFRCKSAKSRLQNALKNTARKVYRKIKY